jgi:hypothetical protein
MLRLMILFIFILVIPQFANARLSKQGLTPVDKVQASQLILIVEVIEDSDADLKSRQIKKNIEKIRVIEVIKGDAVPHKLLFVTNGYTSENSSQCCEFGERYLVFLEHGFSELEEVNDVIYLVLKEKDKYVSGADNAWSTYKIQDKQVVGWPFGGVEVMQLRVVKKEIRRYIKNQKEND